MPGFAQAQAFDLAMLGLGVGNGVQGGDENLAQARVSSLCNNADALQWRFRVVQRSPCRAACGTEQFQAGTIDHQVHVHGAGIRLEGIRKPVDEIALLKA